MIENCRTLGLAHRWRLASKTHSEAAHTSLMPVGLGPWLVCKVCGWATSAKLGGGA